MADTLRLKIHLAVAEDDVSDLIRHGWLARDPDPAAGILQVRFTPKGKAEIAVFDDKAASEQPVIGYQDDTGRQWVIGRLERQLSTEALPLTH